MPAVSVIVPAFNRADSIAATLDSLVAQTLVDWEAIVVDDGSTDATAVVVESYAKTDPRIRLVKQENAGVSAARNHGIELAQGTWMFFLDADDWVTNDALALLVKAAEHDPTSTIAIGRSVLVLPGGDEVLEPPPPPGEHMFSELARKCAYSIHTSLQPTELVQAVGGFDTSLVTCEDWDLWQRIARTRPHYVYVPEKLAYYRVRPVSASRDPLRILLDGLPVIQRGHGEDPRLAGWPGQLHQPINPEWAPAAIVYMSAYCAGLAIGAGQDPTYLLEHVPPVTHHDVDGSWLASSLFYSIPAGLCQPLSAWPRLPSEVYEHALRFVSALGAKTDDALLTRTAVRSFEALVAEQTLKATGASSATIGSTQVARAVLGSPLRDTLVPVSVDRLILELSEGGDEPAGSVIAAATLPATDGVIPALVASDALADESAWELISSLLDSTVFASLNLVRSNEDVIVRRGWLELGHTPFREDAERFELIQEAAGWTLFLQELWGLPELTTGDFYGDVEVESDASAPELSVADETIVEVEVAKPLPLVRSNAADVLFHVSIAGLPLMAIRVPTREGVISPHRLRRAITVEGKFELCQVAVRETVLQSSWPHGTPLRSRLNALADQRERLVDAQRVRGLVGVAAKHAALIEEFAPAGHHAVIVGRRQSRLFTGAASRSLSIPYAASEEIIERARQSQQLVLEHGESRMPSLAMYLPYVFDPETLARAVDPDLNPRASEFEEIFMEEDPWDYTNPYEERKYHETMRLLPSRSARALEVGCAEGAFTRLLAGQVDHLTAVDISATAIARARARCSDLDNVEFATYDVFAPDAEPVGEGKFDLIVASEVLYYAPDLESLRLALRRLVSALAPDGALVVVHANLVVDEPSQPGFDWNLAAGSAGIHAELEKLGNVALSEQRHARYFTAERWERAGGHSRLFRRRPKSEVLDGIPEPPPRALRTFLPDGGNVDDTDSDASTGLLPVLMYHRIAPETPAAGARWAITPEGFEEQLAWLREQNFESTSVEEWALACANDRDLPGRRVLITFDDGLQDFADHALPLLVKYGYKADMHIVSGRVGQTNDWEMAGFPRYRLMDWDTLADLPRHTVTLGSHTVNHRSFAVLDPVEAMQELIRSRVTLEDRLGRAINRIAFPYGSFDHSTLLQAAAAGYDYAYTTNDWLAGRDRNPLRIPRLDVWGGLGINQFATLVTTGIQEAGVAGA